MRTGSCLGLAVACTLGGCSLAPHYEHPTSPPAGAAYQETGDWKVAAPADNVPRGA